MDKSELDGKYFTNNSTYNCPYCKRNNVSYSIEGVFQIDWTNTKNVYGYLVKCSEGSCKKTSLHLSNFLLRTSSGQFSYPTEHYVTDTTPQRKSIVGLPGPPQVQVDPLYKGKKTEKLSDSSINEVDDLFFYHKPTSYFTLNNLITSEVRKPLDEAENCLSSGYITGASACLRKCIYKLLKHQKIAEQDDSGKFIKFEERLKILSEGQPADIKEYFENIKGVYYITSQEVHENDWKDLDAGDLRFLIESTKEVLEAIYVTPKLREERAQKIQSLRKNKKD
ncbi:MAG: hypothetical protein VX341_13730 [Bdellovibrionota bacterium]|nr:hypothetical protein [Bdellovibrionota bacterium]